MDKLQKRVKTPVLDYVPAELRKGAKGRWMINFYAFDPINGKLKRFQRRVRPMDSIRQRERFGKRMAAEINSKLERGWNPIVEMEAPNSFSMLSDVMDTYLRQIEKQVSDDSLRPDTLRAYTSYIENIKKFMEENGNLDLFTINFNRGFVQNFLDHIYYGRKNSPRTYNNYLLFIKNFSNYMLLREFISKNPTDGIPRKKADDKIRTIIPPSIRKQIFNYLKQNNPDYLTFCLLTYYCLTRRTEGTKLLVSDIDMKNGVLNIRASVSKNRKKQQVTIPTTYLHRLVQHINKATTNNYLFSEGFKPGRKEIEPKKVSDEWNKMRKTLDLPKEYQFYSLKDTGITDLLDAGVSPLKVRDHARHSDLATTEKYTRRKSLGDAELRNSGVLF